MKTYNINPVDDLLVSERKLVAECEGVRIERVEVPERFGSWYFATRPVREQQVALSTFVPDEVSGVMHARAVLVLVEQVNRYVREHF